MPDGNDEQMRENSKQYLLLLTTALIELDQKTKLTRKH